MQAETILHAPRTSGERSAARLRLEGEELELYFETRGHAISSSADGFLIASLLPAMHAGRALVVEAPISARLLQALPRAQAILSSWCSSLRTIDVRAERGGGPASRGAGVGAFFSLGVDSFHTVKEHSRDLTHLVTVKGFDLATLDENVWAAIIRNAARVADDRGKELVVVDTNVRELRPRIQWKWLHGPALASVGHFLAPLLGTVHISSSVTPGSEGPWGSHPLLDPLWSSDALEVVHSGKERSRVAKMVEIANEALVAETLRVCLFSNGHEYNCGRCEKCVGAMLVMHAIGKLEGMTTLPPRVDVRILQELDLARGSRPRLFGETLELLRASGADPALVRSLERALRAARVRRALASVRSRASGTLRRMRSWST
jgi:hypothetical protein